MLPKQQIRLAVDAVVFGYSDNELFVLLIKQKYGTAQGKWVLPGGFVQDTEPISKAVERELKEEAGLKVQYMEQLYTFGDDIDRDPRGRVVSVAYFALVNALKFKPVADTDAEEAQWFNIKEVPNLAYDHNQILTTATERLKAKLLYQPIGFNLLPRAFSFSELEQLYMTILDKKIDRRNFRKKVFSFELLTETDKVKKIGSGRPAKLYRFNKQKYKDLAKSGFLFEIKFA